MRRDFLSSNYLFFFAILLTSFGYFRTTVRHCQSDGGPPVGRWYNRPSGSPFPAAVRATSTPLAKRRQIERCPFNRHVPPAPPLPCGARGTFCTRSVSMSRIKLTLERMCKERWRKNTRIRSIGSSTHTSPTKMSRAKMLVIGNPKAHGHISITTAAIKVQLDLRPTCLRSRIRALLSNRKKTTATLPPAPPPILKDPREDRGSSV